MMNDMFNGNDDSDNQKEKKFAEETISNEQLIFFNKTTNLWNLLEKLFIGTAKYISIYDTETISAKDIL